MRGEVISLPNLLELGEGNPEGSCVGRDEGVRVFGFAYLYDLSAFEGGEFPVGSACFGLAWDFIADDHELILAIGVSVSPGSGADENNGEDEDEIGDPARDLNVREMAEADKEEADDPKSGCEDEPLVGPESEEAGAGKRGFAHALADAVHESARLAVERREEKSGMAGSASASRIIDCEIGDCEILVEARLAGGFFDELLVLRNGVAEAAFGKGKVGFFEGGSPELTDEKKKKGKFRKLGGEGF